MCRTKRGWFSMKHMTFEAVSVSPFLKNMFGRPQPSRTYWLTNARVALAGENEYRGKLDQLEYSLWYTNSREAASLNLLVSQ